jgi:ATP-dependent DNA helicase RecG
VKGEITIFVSSVQKELADCRRAVKTFIENDPLLRRFFRVFLFEDLPARDRRADAVYLAEVDGCAIYVGLFGNDYGFEDTDGLSPTEREFDRATAQCKPRFIFVKGESDKQRHPKMQTLIHKAGSQLIRRRFNSIADLNAAVYASLVDYLETCGIVQTRPFEERPCADATINDLNVQVVRNFVSSARLERQFPLPAKAPLPDILTHLHLLHQGQPTNAALLLFGRDPQRFLPCAEVRCMHFHGTEVQRPVPFYRIFKCNAFEQVDMAVDFVVSKLNRSIGTRAESIQAPVRYEIPHDVIREAIVNAVAHRDYTSAGAVQVSVFTDRVEVWNPGTLPASLTTESLRHPHGSIPRNHRLCEVLFLARYIEKYGTGTLMMIRESLAHDLPEPSFAQRGGEFTVALWRDWLTTEVLAKLGLNDRQIRAVAFLKSTARITNADYQTVTGATRPTAKRDLEDLVKKRVVEPMGGGRGSYYELRKKWLINGSNGSLEGPK